MLQLSRAKPGNPASNIIFMSGAHGVNPFRIDENHVWALWGGDGWVSVDRGSTVVPLLWHLGGFGAVVLGNTVELEVRGFP